MSIINYYALHLTICSLSRHSRPTLDTIPAYLSMTMIMLASDQQRALLSISPQEALAHALVLQAVVQMIKEQDGKLTVVKDL